MKGDPFDAGFLPAMGAISLMNDAPTVFTVHVPGILFHANYNISLKNKASQRPKIQILPGKREYPQLS